MINKTLRIFALMFVIGAASLTIACGGGDEAADQQATEPAAQSASMVLYQYKFNPNTLSVAPGTTVVFENKDPERHNVTIPALNVDQSIEPGQTWSYTFDTTGEFALENRFASAPMTATISVQ